MDIEELSKGVKRRLKMMVMMMVMMMRSPPICVIIGDILCYVAIIAHAAVAAAINIMCNDKLGGVRIRVPLPMDIEELSKGVKRRLKMMVMMMVMMMRSPPICVFRCKEI
ncbi:hypothetical protein WUBG_17408 [Wuchereria bancrofti]|uniref:Uncharacterized protein n=1 Tax=Wuchereria bancrofti TaxID=6293 RepID=J9E8K4_WUCBA|nr:hypothetical protein WUBG_17408 [Wuchereria bancrofti]